MHVIIGLGNPGLQYADTRHNIGAKVVSQAARQWSIPFTSGVLAQLGSGRLNGASVVLALPFTFMNRSGEAVEWIINQFGVQSHQLVIVHDDLDLPIGRLRIKFDGGTGGHNGLHSIVMALGTEEFYRVKIGINHPESGEDPADYVLSPFSQSESSELEVVMSRAVEALECLITHGADEAMNRFNRKVQE